MTLQNVGQFFRTIRKSKNLSQEALAELADVSYRQVRRMEKGDPIKVEALYAIMRILNIQFCSIDEEFCTDITTISVANYFALQRRNKNITGASLAIATKLTVQTISHFENFQNIETTSLLLIMDALDIVLCHQKT